jgi:hypothetical protein
MVRSDAFSFNNLPIGTTFLFRSSSSSLSGCLRLLGLLGRAVGFLLMVVTAGVEKLGHVAHTFACCESMGYPLTVKNATIAIVEAPEEPPCAHLPPSTVSVGELLCPVQRLDDSIVYLPSP